MLFRSLMTARELQRRYALISFLTWLPTGLYIPVLVVPALRLEKFRNQ